jgi:hypothetical protein
MKGLKGLRVCRTAYLAHCIPVWFRCGAVPNGPERPEPESSGPVGAKVRSGRRGGSPGRTMDYRI